MRLLLSIHAVLIVAFAAFLGSTWFARDFIHAQAQDFVTEKTLQYAKPVVEVADGLIEAPFIARELSDEQVEAAKAEIKLFQQAPREYVEQLTGKRPQPAIAPKRAPLPKKVQEIKTAIVEYYDGMLHDLVADLRVFGSTNLIASCIAFLLTLASGPSQTLKVITVIIGAAVLFMSFLYVDGMTFFKIFSRGHMGYAYPAMLTLTVGYGVYSYAQTRLTEGLIGSTADHQKEEGDR